jgi:tripartite-type tricarboxylate transporter receptor subunit TctC
MRFCLSLLVALTLVAAANVVHARAADGGADDFPSRPIRLVVGFAPGGASDLFARILSAPLSKELGQSVFVDNVPGASGLLGWKAVAAANPDGMTLLMAENALAIRPGFKDDTPRFDPVAQLDAIALTGHSPLVLCVSPRLAVNSVPDLIKLSRNTAGKLNYASAGAGSVAQLVWEVVRDGMKMEVVNVPYRGGGPAMAGMVAGQDDLIMASTPVAKPYIDSGMVKGLVVTGTERSPALPQIPTLAELSINHVDVDLRFWFGVFAPKGVPGAVREKIEHAIAKAVAAPDVREKLAALDVTPGFAPAAAMEAQLQSEIRNWGSFIEAHGITDQ